MENDRGFIHRHGWKVNARSEDTRDIWTKGFTVSLTVAAVHKETFLGNPKSHQKLVADTCDVDNASQPRASCIRPGASHDCKDEIG